MLRERVSADASRSRCAQTRRFRVSWIDCQRTRPVLARHELREFPCCRQCSSKLRASTVDIRSLESRLTKAESRPPRLISKDNTGTTRHRRFVKVVITGPPSLECVDEMKETKRTHSHSRPSVSLGSSFGHATVPSGDASSSPRVAHKAESRRGQQSDAGGFRNRQHNGRIAVDIKPDVDRVAVG